MSKEQMNTNRRAALAVLVVILLAGCGGSKKLETYFEESDAIIARFDDAAEVANSTPRMQLSGVISDLQEIQREAEELEAPEEAQKNKKHLLEWMEYTTDGFIAFMGQKDDDVVARAFEGARIARNRYLETRMELEE